MSDCNVGRIYDLGCVSQIHQGAKIANKQIREDGV